MATIDAAIIKALVDHVGSDLPTNPSGTVKVKNLEAETLKVEGSQPWCEMDDYGIYFNNEVHCATNLWISNGDLHHESGTAYFPYLECGGDLKANTIFLADMNLFDKLMEYERRISDLEAEVAALKSKA